MIARELRSVYQPIVDLESGEVVAYEALARGPEDSALESPAALFGAAREEGRLIELDRACRASSVRGALAAGLRAPAALFVNIEPGSMDGPIEAFDREIMLAAREQLPIFFEVTERALTSNPAQLLEKVERMRAAGLGIALDDVGADRRSLALLPLLRPDVVKLDMSLIHQHPSHRSGEVMNGVCAYAEQTGAAIIAEGVETEQHLLAARSLGADLVQGWYFGRPGPIALTSVSVRSAPLLGLPPRGPASSPVELVHPGRPLKIGRKDVLLSITRALEAEALGLAEHGVIVAAFQQARQFTPKTRSRYARLGARASLTVALGVGMTDAPAAGVRGASLAPTEPLVGEWDLAVLGPHFAGALVARDLGDSGPDRERRFEFVLTFDRELVVNVAATLIARVSGSPDPSAPIV